MNIHEAGDPLRLRLGPSCLAGAYPVREVARPAVSAPGGDVDSECPLRTRQAGLLAAPWTTSQPQVCLGVSVVQPAD